MLLDSQSSVPAVAHLLWDSVPQLSLGTGERIFSRIPNSRIYLRSVSGLPEAKSLKRNRRLADKAAAAFGGILARSWIWRHVPSSGKIGALVRNATSEFSLAAWWRIFRGPRFWVIHGAELSLATALIFRLLGKRLLFIHWGGVGSSRSRWLRGLHALSLHLHERVFVLISPEVRYFAPLAGARRVEMVPYFSKSGEGEYPGCQPSQDERAARGIILGNSGNQLEGYPSILDRLDPQDWDRIICMVNYGGDRSRIDAFETRYREKFGERLVVWRKVVPFAEYLTVLAQCSFYACPGLTQSGLGAINQSIRQGKTILIRGDNYEWMRFLGVKVENLDDLPSLSGETLEKIRLTPEEQERNCRCFYDAWHTKYSFDAWARQMLAVFGFHGDDR